MTGTGRRRSWWGWGWEDEALSPETVRKLGEGDRRPVRPGRPGGARAHSARLAPAAGTPGERTGRAGRAVLDDHVRSRLHTYGKSYRDVVRGFRGDLPAPPDVVAFPSDEGRRGRAARLVRRRQRGRGPLRRRIVGGRRRRSRPRERQLRRRGVHRSHPTRPRARGRHGVAGGAHPGRRARPGARGAAATARLHAAPLPAVVRVLDARRLAGHALGRPLRQRVHPHRRPWPSRSAWSRRAASWSRAACPARARGRRPIGSCSARRARSASSPRRGCACRTACGSRRRPACASRPRGRRWRGAAVAQSGLFPTNCRLLDAGEAMIAAGVDDGSSLLVLGFESADHPVDAWIAARRRAVPGPRRHRAGRREEQRPDRREHDGGGPRRGRGRVAQLVPARAVRARRARVDGRHRRDVRDRVHVVAVPRPPRRRDGGGREGARRDLRRRMGHVPVHPRVPRRAGAVLLRDRPRTVRLRARDVGRDQGGRLRGAARTAARSPTTMRSAAITGPGTTGSGPSRSPTRCAPPSTRSTPPASSTRAC